MEDVALATLKLRDTVMGQRSNMANGNRGSSLHGMAWTQELEIAKRSIAVRRLMSDGIADCRRERRCLGRAEGMLSDGLRLIACSLDAEGIQLMTQVVAFATAAYEDDESNGYTPIGGQNLFANYVALRAICLAKWCIGDVYLDVQAAMIECLDKAAKLAKTSSAVAVGHLLLHLAESGQWDSISRMEALQSARNTWGKLVVELSFVASTGLDDKASVGRFDAFFRDITEGSHSGLFEEDLTWPDVVSIARVRAKLLRTSATPVDVIRSVREPNSVVF